jgi:transposase
MHKKSQKKYTAEEKLQILQEGEYGIMSINEVCRRHGISAVTYYHWRKQARQAMLEGFRGGNGKRKNRHEQELEDQIRRLRNTIIEITQENIDLKKKNYK